MNWDQIERKWEEMTRRVQSPSSLPSVIQAKTLKDQVELSPMIDPAASPTETGRLIARKS